MATAGATSSNSVPDVIASTANNLKTDGWVSGQTWGYEVTLPQNFDYLLADRSKQMTVREWQNLGVRRAGNRPFPHGDDRDFLLIPAGARGPAFLMLQNFRVIMNTLLPKPMRSPSAISPTGCAAARRSCRIGRATSAC